VLRYLPANLPRHKIAAELSVPVNTASTHIRSIYAKLQVSDRSSAVPMLIGSRAGSQQNERLSAMAGSCGPQRAPCGAPEAFVAAGIP
jgi:Bacterial regulatory proteins, luxR family